MAGYHQVTRRLKRRNLIVTVIFGVTWFTFYALMATGGTSLVSPPVLLLLIPLVLGVAYVGLLDGEWFERAMYALATPIVPVILVTALLAGSTDSEGVGFVWLYASAPLLPFWIGAATMAAAVALRKRVNTEG